MIKKVLTLLALCAALGGVAVPGFAEEESAAPAATGAAAAEEVAPAAAPAPTADKGDTA